MRIEQCWFCGGPIYPGHGTMFVRNDCKVFRFCRSKCSKNFKKKKNPRKVKWTLAYRQLHSKKMTMDSSLSFEKKRNRPLKYNRITMQTVIRSIKRIEQIRKAREDQFWYNRMKGNEKQEALEALKDLHRNISLIEPDVVRAKKRREAEMELENKAGVEEEVVDVEPEVQVIKGPVSEKIPQQVKVQQKQKQKQNK
eukprot:TRINITY_DN2331_c0_g1_i1.p1 TRINITY_DN2331_c0_g1~~TRINITY_DN2331_c0_g1_i1.p1  ORF type:complete len:196 (-),score=33.14 TRINITY_DN2331_c0_g1_i1:106-693(-)